MALTPPGDLYFGLNDSLFPKLLAAIQSQRPSLLNFMTPYFAQRSAYWCSPIPQPINGAPQFFPFPAVQFSSGTAIPPTEFVLQITDFSIGFRFSRNAPLSG